MADEKNSWKRFQRVAFDSKSFSKRAKKAETVTTRHAHKFVIKKLDSLRNVKQHVVIWLVIVGVLISAIALQTYWNQKAYRTMAWKEDGTYAEAVIGAINTLNPLYATTPAEQAATKLLFSSLYSYDDTSNLSDDLATSMTVSKDEKEYVIKLRNDATWSDGVKLTARDVVFTVNLMKSPDARSVMFYNGNWANVAVEALDDTTVKFTLPGKYASFPHALTFAVLPQHVLESMQPGAIRQSTFSVSPVGSGPFKLKLLQNSSSESSYKIVNMAASDRYYKGELRLSRFELHAYKNQDDAIKALQTGQVSAAAGVEINKSELPPSFSLKRYPVNSGVYALFNSSSELLKNSKLRQALQIGTDVQDAKKTLGYDVPDLYLPFVEGQIHGGGIPAMPVYNQQKAKQLLEGLGWKLKNGDTVRKNKKGQELAINITTVKDVAYEKILEQLAGQWRELGFKVHTEIKDPNDVSNDFVQTVLQPRNYDVLLYKLVIGVDPDVYAYWHSSQASQSGYNFANYSSDLSDDALSTARIRSDPALRNEKYKAFATQWLKDVPAIGLYQSVMQYAYRPSVLPDIPATGIPSEEDRYSNILYWSAEQRPVYKTP